jgi:hypothetical protein
MTQMEIAPIDFGEKIAFNIRHEDYKKNILKELFDRYKVIVTENSCFVYDKKNANVIINQLNMPNHIVSTNTKGNRYFLYFRRDEFDKNMCIFIDRKICRGYTQPRIIYTNFRMDNKVFNGTLFQGELVKMPNNKWIFMMNDMLASCGRRLINKNKMVRLKSMYELLRHCYTSDSILDVCDLQVKRFFTYKELPKLLQTIKKLPYQVNGLVFNSLRAGKPDILLLHNFDTKYKRHIKTNTMDTRKKDTHEKMRQITTIQEDVREDDMVDTIDLSPTMSMASTSFKQLSPDNISKPKKTNPKAEAVINTTKKATKIGCKDKNINTETFAFILSKIEGGIFQLISLVNRNEKIFGIARIDKMKTQKMVERVLKNSNTKNKVLMDCKYNKKFNKFVPVSVSEKSEADQFLDVTNYVKKSVN